jgi:hypothetical protein
MVVVVIVVVIMRVGMIAMAVGIVVVGMAVVMFMPRVRPLPATPQFPERRDEERKANQKHKGIARGL